MKKLSFALGAIMTLSSFAAAAEETPMITFKTNIYDTYGASNSFHIVLGATEDTYFDIDYGFGTEEVAVGPAYYDEDSQAVKGTSFSMSVGSEGIVKIYGDPKLIDYFDAEGCYIDWIDFGDCTNLDIIDLQHNELKRLDLSKYTNLSAIYLSDNPFTQQTPLVIGNNHPNLIILEVDIVDWISPDFDICYYPNLISFDAYANKTLTHLDPTKCPNLMRLSVDSAPIKTIDVSKNPLLQVLNVSDSGISSLDLSNNPNLQQLYVDHDSPRLHPEAKFTSLDISKNTNLWYLAAGGNLLTDIDLSQNKKLSHIRLSDNYLTSIDLSHLDPSQIYYLNLAKNYMSFANLPLPQAGWEYYYNQRPIALEREYKTGTTLNFSDKVLRAGTTTDCLLYSYDRASGESNLVDESFYSYADGKLTVLKETTDSVYASFANSSFMEYPMTTGMFKVSLPENYGKPSPAVSIGTTVKVGQKFEMSVGIAGASESNPVKFFVDFGDGKLAEFTASGEELPLAPNVTSTVKGEGNVIVYIPQGQNLTAVGLDNMGLFELDVTKASNLRYLSAANTGITAVDLRMNNALRSLNLSGNRLTSLDLSGANGALEKSFLRNINLAGNRLSTIVLNDTRAIDVLDLSNNRLSEFDYKEFEYIKEFNISNNDITAINLAYFTSATKVDVSGNSINDIKLPETNVFEYFNLSNNAFTLENLPYLSGFDYVYAPQPSIKLPQRAPGANLNAQNRVIDGKGTTFTWRFASDNSIVPADKIRVDGGSVHFVDTDMGAVYCEMTNPAFPAFTGEDMFRTTAVIPSPMPTHCIASFTTPVGGQPVELSLAGAAPGTAIFFDWDGQGFTAEQYILDTRYTLFEATTVEGANVSVLTYSPADEITVFSMTGASLSDADFSSLTDAICISVTEAGLEEIKLPEGSKLEELSLDGSSFTENSIDLAKFPNLRMLAINDNKFTTLDLTANPKLEVVAAAYNQISSVVLDNPYLWFLVLDANNLSELDLSKAKRVSQLGLSQNKFRSINIEPLVAVKDLLINSNYFTFATLPSPELVSGIYAYTNQAPLTPSVYNHKCDLASQAYVDGVATQYRWFVGVPEINENGELEGEELYVDDEYTIEDGITTFLIQYDGIMCVMTNEVFPNLYLYTNLLSTEDGVEAIAGDEVEISATLSGSDILVKAHGVADGTPVALYSVDGRQLASTAVRGEEAVIASAPRGHVILAVGGHSFKLFVKE